MTNDNWLSDEQERIENERAVWRELDRRDRTVNVLVAILVLSVGIALWGIVMLIILVLHLH